MSKLTGGAVPPRPSLGGGVRPALSLEAIEKAKKALQLQKEIQEKLKNRLPQLQAKLAAKTAVDGEGAPVAASPMVALAAKKAAEIAARLGSTVAPIVETVAAATAAAAPVQTAASTAVVLGSVAKLLRVNAQGQEVDEEGRVIQQKIVPVTSLKVNEANRTVPSPAAPAAAEETGDDPFFDPRIGNRGSRKLERRLKMGLEFVPEGKFRKEAELMRLKAQYGAKWGGSRRDAPSVGPRGNSNFTPLGLGGANLVPLGKRAAEEEEPEAELVDPSLKEAAETAAILAALGPPPPEVEWWDKLVLQQNSYSPLAGDDGTPALEDAPIPVKESKITIYVEHPVLREPPAEPPAPPPQPLKLTPREIKKLRTQRRLAREREKQELVRQGLLEPPKPKVKISNLHRVLATEAALDPTAMDLEVRRQMAERQAAHEDRNLARMLTPAERRAKKMRKLFDQDGDEVICSVYRVSRLDNFMHRLKVEMNAKENHMTGVAACVKEDIGIVVVEGCPKSTKRYLKLMLRRIDWNARRPNNSKDDMDEDDDEDEEGPVNRCHLVWQGQIKSRAFRGFRVERDISLEEASSLFREVGASHYWDAAISFNPQEAPIITL